MDTTPSPVNPATPTPVVPVSTPPPPAPVASPPPAVNPVVLPPTQAKTKKFPVPIPVAIGCGCLTLLVVLGIIGIVIRGISGKAALTVNNLAAAQLSAKYTTDTDSDVIPDEIETAVGLDPKVSEFTRCQPAGCDSQSASQAQTTTNNILFIIDSSGSMGLTIGNRTKMDLAKDAIRNFMKSVASNVKVGIMVYGDKGSNAASDKTASCNSADVIAPIGSVNTSSVEGYLGQIKPVGWTPIGLAITKAKDAFVGKEGQKNQIIIVTDGAETCNTNPAGAAAAVKASPLAIQVDVIGFAVTAADQSSLQAISTSGGGLFSLATNSDQLLSQIQASRANFDKFQAGAKCTLAASQQAVTCLQEAEKKAYDYLSTQLVGKKGQEFNVIINLQTKISSGYNAKINAIQDAASAALKNSQQQLVK